MEIIKQIFVILGGTYYYICIALFVGAGIIALLYTIVEGVSEFKEKHKKQ